MFSFLQICLSISIWAFYQQVHSKSRMSWTLKIVNLVFSEVLFTSDKQLDQLWLLEFCRDVVQSTCLEPACSWTLEPFCCSLLRNQWYCLPSVECALAFSKCSSASISRYGQTYLEMRFKRATGLPICLLPLHWELSWAMECVQSFWTT